MLTQNNPNFRFKVSSPATVSNFPAMLCLSYASENTEHTFLKDEHQKAKTDIGLFIFRCLKSPVALNCRSSVRYVVLQSGCGEVLCLSMLGQKAADECQKNKKQKENELRAKTFHVAHAQPSDL